MAKKTLTVETRPGQEQPVLVRGIRIDQIHHRGGQPKMRLETKDRNQAGLQQTVKDIPTCITGEPKIHLQLEASRPSWSRLTGLRDGPMLKKMSSS